MTDEKNNTYTLNNQDNCNFKLNVEQWRTSQIPSDDEVEKYIASLSYHENTAIGGYAKTLISDEIRNFHEWIKNKINVVNCIIPENNEYFLECHECQWQGNNPLVVTLNETEANMLCPRCQSSLYSM